jgi:hypothetical protein
VGIRKVYQQGWCGAIRAGLSLSPVLAFCRVACGVRTCQELGGEWPEVEAPRRSYNGSRRPLWFECLLGPE